MYMSYHILLSCIVQLYFDHEAKSKHAVQLYCTVVLCTRKQQSSTVFTVTGAVLTTQPHISLHIPSDQQYKRRLSPSPIPAGVLISVLLLNHNGPNFSNPVVAIGNSRMDCRIRVCSEIIRVAANIASGPRLPRQSDCRARRQKPQPQQQQPPPAISSLVRGGVVL